MKMNLKKYVAVIFALFTALSVSVVIAAAANTGEAKPEDAVTVKGKSAQTDGIVLLDSKDDDRCGDDLTWSLDDTGTLTISGTGDMWDYDSSSGFPWYDSSSKISSVVIGDGVNSISDYAFEDCSNLTKIIFMGDAPSSFGKECFQGLRTATAYYPAGNKSWTGSVMQDYSGSIAWVEYDPDTGIPETAFTGFAMHNGSWYYYVDGVLDSTRNDVISGTVNNTSGWYEVIGGQVQTNHTGVTNVSNEYGWWYVVNGKVDFSFTGFAQNKYGWWQVNKGQVNFSESTVKEATVNGKSGWYEIIGGRVQTDHTGVTNVSNQYGWWYVEDGKVDFSKNSVEENNYGWWYVVNGKVDFSFTGFAQNKYGWWQVNEGQVNFSESNVKEGTLNGKSGWYEVIGGQVQTNHTGVTNVSNQYGWWYVEDGKVVFSFTGFAQNKNGWWQVNDGKVNFSESTVKESTLNGVSGWYEVIGGQVQTDHTGVTNVSNQYGWWYVVNGKVDFSKNSVEENNYGWWYVVDGKVDFSKTGIEPNEWGWWRIVNGAVDFSCNSVEPNEWGWWYIVGGKVQFNYTGIADYANAYGWWYIEDGEVDFSFNGIAKNTYGFWMAVNGKVDFSFTGFIWPLENDTYITSSFGYRTNPVTGIYSLHRGIDIRASRGTPILASMDGTVIANAYDSELGWYIDIEHPGGHVMTRYQHMDSQSPVEIGTTVSQGDVIGYVGTTGSSTGYHLHFGVRYDGTFVDPMLLF